MRPFFKLKAQLFFHLIPTNATHNIYDEKIKMKLTGIGLQKLSVKVCLLKKKLLLVSFKKNIKPTNEPYHIMKEIYSRTLIGRDHDFVLNLAKTQPYKCFQQLTVPKVQKKFSTDKRSMKLTHTVVTITTTQHNSEFWSKFVHAL